MKKLLILLIGLFTASIALTDWDQTYIRDAGRTAQTQVVTVSSSVATGLNTQSVYYANMDLFNNSAYTLWIGTNTTTLMSTGFPILSSTTYTMDGRWTDIIYGLADSSAAGSINVRVISYVTQR